MIRRYIDELTRPLDEEEDIPLSFPTLLTLMTSGAYVLMARGMFDDWERRTRLGKLVALLGIAVYLMMLPFAVVMLVAGVVMMLVELTPRVLVSAYEDHAFVAQKTNEREN